MCVGGADVDVGGAIVVLSLSSSPAAWLSWSALDTRIGGWLLDPDHPPDSFPRLLVRVGMQPAAGSVENDVRWVQRSNFVRCQLFEEQNFAIWLS